ncbi:hypothetical protein Vafri_22014 [Volvox africanus]|uniref:fumarate reductase (NADH) n=1 Tax=Volvox africanus TaxID=51714 RepID=A0A8J4FFH3_9CHLO|nr:hypothetical protein Vafri_22014 [Volvox africanus]
MRRISSSQQNRGITIGAEQCMQRPQTRCSPAVRATFAPHRARPWLFVLLVSVLGFGLLITLWTWLPPSTVLGATAQAQAQAQAEQSTRVHAHPSHSSTTSASTGSGSRHKPQAGSLASDPIESSHASVAVGSSLLRQAQQQLQQQKVDHHRKQQQQQQQQHYSFDGGRGGFRGGIGSSSSSSNSRGSSSSNSTKIMPSSALAKQHEEHQKSSVPPSAQVVVVGGGLAGLVAALQAAECLAEAEALASAVSPVSSSSTSCMPVQCGGSAATIAPSYAVGVLLVEKMPKLGGNSAKASSGINALYPEGGDSEELFRSDVASSGGGGSNPELVETLVRHSPSALSFLSAHGAALTAVTQLGGHSVPRTRTVAGGANVGWVLMSALMEAVRKQPRIKVLEGHSLRRIITAGELEGEVSSAHLGDDDKNPHAVAEVELGPAGGPDGAAAAASGPAYLSSPLSRVTCGALVLATGGFAANKELIQSVQPEAVGLATTNGPWARGESLAQAAAAGAALVGLKDVQIHPTGFVDPADPGAGTKFLAPEKLRGVGGLLLDDQGNRFVDELARRDTVAGAMMRLPGRIAWLLLGRDAGTEYGTSALDFYCKRGLMRKVETLSAAATAMGVSLEHLKGQLDEYTRVAAGGNVDSYGKRVFPNPPDPDQQLPLYLARVTPVVHYTMGGVAINERAEVLRAGPGGAPDGSGATIKGLYAAGEVTGGLHGRNRLGGNSLLECAVFGRIAGSQAAACGSR